MSRRTIPVDKQKLIDAISVCEADGPLKNQSALFLATTEEYNKTADEKITNSVAAGRVREWKLEIKTPKGKIGRGPMTDEEKAAMKANRRSRSEKFSANAAVVAAHEGLRKETPERFLPIVERVCGGSMAQAVKLKCLECSAYMTSEVRQCPVTACALWAFRPYQGAVEPEEAAEQQEDADEEKAAAEAA